ncbi:hypothetical protein UMM65_12435 [Aureibaculum sp. 2210JD6-5]|nr:hypothetical protein [Aureibaculum sp. 2210JD6-5]MDY7396052.1 hypothetical protein [Aureibaculum sp. 2210JD6-5]
MKKISNTLGLLLIHLTNLPLFFLLFVTGQNKEIDRLFTIARNPLKH